MSIVFQATPLGVPVSDELKFLPEGPYQYAEGLLSWVGIQHGLGATVGSVNITNLKSGETATHELPGRPGFAFPCRSSGKFVVGCERSLGIFDTADGSWSPFCDGIDSDVENTIINDGMIHGDNLIFGTKDLEFATKKAGLYLYRGKDKKLIRLRDDQICSNGKATLVVDGELRLYDIDSPTRKIVSYPIDIDSGTLGEATTVLDFEGDPAVPDGMILTPDGTGIIVAMFRPEVAEFGETRLYDIASGERKMTWQTPGSPQNTCPALVVHDDALLLVITTAVENMTSDDQAKCPNAGQLFCADSTLDPSGYSVPIYPA